MCKSRTSKMLAHGDQPIKRALTNPNESEVSISYHG